MLPSRITLNPTARRITYYLLTISNYHEWILKNRWHENVFALVLMRFNGNRHKCRDPSGTSNAIRKIYQRKNYLVNEEADEKKNINNNWVYQKKKKTRMISIELRPYRPNPSVNNNGTRNLNIILYGIESGDVILHR